MRVLFLNAFNGKVKNRVLDFVTANSPKTDVFCFQEAEKPLFDKLSEILRDYKGYRCSKPYINSWTFDQAIFCKNTLKSTCTSHDFLKNGSGLSVDIDDNKVHIFNIHGVSMPGNKFDTEERIQQSKEILNFASLQNNPVVIGGDFNLNPDTMSIKMFEEAGYRNLIKDFNIKTTRNSLAWKNYKNDPDFVKQHFADYVFVSPDVKVKNFEVPNVEISDHLPLILDFEV